MATHGPGAPGVTQVGADGRGTLHRREPTAAAVGPTPAPSLAAASPVAAASVITEEELVERLKGEFGATEVFDEPGES